MARKKQLLAFLLAFALAFTTLVTPTVKAAPGDVIVDPIEGTKDDLLKFYDATGYVDENLGYSALQYLNTAGDKIALQLTMNFKFNHGWGSKTNDMTADNYFWGKFAIRFKDPAFYKQINSITVGSDAMTKYVFPTEQSDRNGSVWALKITDLPYNLIGSINNRNVVITLNDGKSLADLGLDQTKLYFDTAMLRSGLAKSEGKIERQSISNGYILGTEDRSTGTSDWDGARQDFVPADRGGAITRTFIDLTPGSEAIKVTYGFAPKQNFLQADYAWVVYPEQQIPQELVQYINKDALKIGVSDKDGNLNVNRTMSLSSTSLDDSGFMTVSKTNTLSIVYDNPQTLKHLNEVRTNQDANLYYGTLGQPRYFTVSYPLDLVHNKLSDFIDAFGQVSGANNGQIPVTAWLVGDYPNKDIGQTAQKTDLTADNPDGAPRRLPNSLTQTFIASTDSDGDGIPDRSELSLGTDPNAFDTDGDGKSDGQEVIYDSTNPMDAKDYLPEGPKADSTVLKDPAAENVVTGTALPLYSTDPDSETGEKIKPTNSDAGDLIVSLYKYAPTQGDDGDEVPGYEGSSYATTKVSLDELKGEGKYSLTIPANALTDTSIQYVLVATSPNGENPVLGDVIGFEGIQLDPNGGTKADGTSDPENVMTATSGKTTLPLINDWKNGEKQLIGWSTNPQAVEPDQLGEDYLYNGASLDANLLNDDPKTLYAVWADPITISLEKVWKDADGSPATPSVAPVQVGLMYRTAVGIPGAEIINDPLAAYSPVQGSVHELVDGKTSWTLNGYDNTGKRLSYVAIEMPQVEGLTAEQIANEFYAFDQSKQSWANLGVTLVESKQDEDGHITPGYKTQFTQVRNTDDTVDAYSSATRRTPTYKDDQTKNIITAYAITMTNTRLEVAQPTIKQAYTDDTKLEVVAPIDANAQAVVITLPEDRDGDGENDVLVLKTLGNAPYDYAVDPKNSSADAQVTVEIVPDPTDGVPTFVVNGLEPFTVGETATAVAQKYDAETGKTIESKETVMTVKDRVASATPTNPAQGVKTEGNEAVITADAGTVSGVKPPETATFVLLKDDGTGNYVSVTDADGSPVVGSVDPETGKITVNVPEGSNLEHDVRVIIRQQDTPQQTPSDSAPVVVDLQGPTITAQDINGVVNKQLNETITTDEPARLTQEGLVSGLRIDGLAATTDSWTISGAAQVDGAVDKQDLNLTATDVYGNVGTLTVKQSFKAGVSQIDPTADAEEGFVKIVFNAGEGIFAAESNPEIDSSLISKDQKQIAYQVEDQLSWDAAQKLGVIVPTATDPTDGKVFSQWDPALPKGIEHVAEATYTAIFVDPNPPVITAIDDQTVEQGEPIKTVSVQVDDPTATIEVTGLPDGVTYDETSKTISGTPTVDLGTDEQKTFEVTVTASDDDNSVEEKFTITVTKPQLPAGDGYTLADPTPKTVEGIEEDGTENAIKPDEGTKLIPPTESVSGLNVDEDGNLTGTPTVDDWGPIEEERQITIPVGIDTNGDGTADKTVDVPVIIQRDTDGDKTPDVTDTDDDNDGLTDDQETQLTKTDPKKEDTDGNGTTDDKEDLDNDGLTNKEEVNGETEDGTEFPDK
ncbi:MAG: putative Ig domain-containing protein, partial [Peptoniphilaceae bacterium]|nr:putative Ig domain-containing protein [Peptoniphilaceae bacterium]